MNQLFPTLQVSSVISFAEILLDDNHFAEIETLYFTERINHITTQVLAYLQQHHTTAENDLLHLNKPFELEIYVTEPIEARGINLDARGKDYATNILSYPTELPPNVLAILPTLPLGELVICHEVVVSQANEQGKTVSDHLTHLIVHGVLHLLGFDHELGETEQAEQEVIEIAVLKNLGINNPYE